jgi:hypothetical protein
MAALHQHDDELLIDGPAANAFLAVRNAKLLASVARPEDGSSLWILAMLHTAASSLLTVWLEQKGQHESYTEKSVRAARSLLSAANSSVDIDKLRLLPIGELQRKLSAATSDRDAFPFSERAIEVMSDITDLRNFLQHPKPIARGIDHAFAHQLIEFLTVYLSATLRKMQPAYFSDYQSTDQIHDELKEFARIFGDRWSTLAI